MGDEVERHKKRKRGGCKRHDGYRKVYKREGFVSHSTLSSLSAPESDSVI